MRDWKEVLDAIGEDYLIGLSNKGIVKRAYKDKEEMQAAVLSAGEEAKVQVGEETVTICVPLAESRCSCPSRSICRHVILGILVLKESVAGEAGGQKSGQAAEGGQAGDAEAQGEKAKDAEAARGRAGDAEAQGDKAGDAEAASGQEGNAAAQSEKAKDAEAAGGQESGAEAQGEKLRKEIAAYPVGSLCKAMGTRAFQSFLKQVKAGISAQIRTGGVMVVQLPGDAYRVTLLSPLEYSACTCHKKEFCAHKAEAVLWCKLQNHDVTPQELSGQLMESPEYAPEKIRETAERMKGFLLELLETGLPRTSPDILDNLERLSLTAHEAGLANFEGHFRALHDSYQRYLKRVASFRTRDLLLQIMRLYQRTQMLSETKNPSELAELAGEFRAEYLEVGSLELRGVAAQDFESQTGYAGLTVYFLEEHSQDWYTYTSARPVFYDTKGKRRDPARAQAPWGLEMPLEAAAALSLKLTSAKCDDRRRLSSSQETKAEILSGKDGFRWEESRWYYRDFEKLFCEQIHFKENWLYEISGAGQEEILVFLQPAACGKATYAQAEQRLSLPLYDEGGREVTVEVTYSKREDQGIRYLESISGKNPPCFFGKIYLRDGKIRMYPIRTFEPPKRPGWNPFPKAAQEPEPLKKQEQPGSAEALSDLLEEVLQALEIVFQSGFDTPTQAALEEMEKLADLAAQYGMEFLSGSLRELGGLLAARRHSLQKPDRESRERPARMLCELAEYLYLGREKVIYDMALENYR